MIGFLINDSSSSKKTLSDSEIPENPNLEHRTSKESSSISSTQRFNSNKPEKQSIFHSAKVTRGDGIQLLSISI